MPESAGLKARINEDMKTAMRGGDKPRLGVIRLILAAIKQREVDERITMDDAQILAVLEKMLKQRRDSVTQYLAGKRQDLADQETFEIGVIQAYMPQPLGEAEIDAAIAAAIAESGAASARDMGKAMALLKPRLQGRADMGAVSAKLKQRLGG
jgi:uncharacterized protein YqeY